MLLTEWDSRLKHAKDNLFTSSNYGERKAIHSLISHFFHIALSPVVSKETFRSISRSFPSFLDLKKEPFRTLNWYLLGSKSVPESFEIVCVTVSLEVLEFSIPERKEYVPSKIMTSRKGPKMTETVEITWF